MVKETPEDRAKKVKEVKRRIQKEIYLEEKAIKYELNNLELLDENISFENLDKLKENNQEINNLYTNFLLNEEDFIIDKEDYIRFRDRHFDKSFVHEVNKLLTNMPISNGSKYYKKFNVTIGIISDEFLFNSFKDTANFIYIHSDNYKEHKDNLDLLLVATTWKGLRGEWNGLGNPTKREHRNTLFQIIEFYKKENIRTVFYSKEDPVNYDIFIEIAAKCDYIFTTAIECVEKYKNECNNKNVSVLSFGINPLIHNPVGIKRYPKREEILFAGSWYEKYPDRQKETREIFDGIIEAGSKLKIIDRNFDRNLEPYFFPQEYIKYISPSFNHADLQKLHRLYNWSLNFNSVKFSETMFANRVLEVQALGNILLSNYNTGINNKFPNVFLIHQKNEVKSILKSFTPEEIYKHQIWGIRRVMSRETTFHRMEDLFKTIHFKYEKPQHKVAVIVREKTEYIEKMFNRQTYQEKELVLESEFNEDRKRDFSFIAFFEENKDYKMFYLEDMINAFKYTNSDYVTKDSYYDGNELIPGTNHDYIDLLKDKYRAVFWSDSFETEELKGLEDNAGIPNGYSIDPFEFNNKVLTERIEPKKECVLSVIIPTYNNGDHLMHKCFNSLKRSSLFNEMEIIIIDLGSTDQYTPHIINSIQENYSNVKLFLYRDRNNHSELSFREKGIELATTQYVTFLDPNNEAINDGYAKLFKEISKSGYDIVLGNMIKIGNEVQNINNYKIVKTKNYSDEITDYDGDFLIKFGSTISLQSLLINKELFIKTLLRSLENNRAQDSFVGELLKSSNITKVINEDIYIYYTEVESTIVN